MSSETASLRSLLDEIVRSATRAWPEVNVPAERFIDYMMGRLTPDLPAEQALGQVHAADVYLACACAYGDPKAIAAFEAHCMGTVDSALAKLHVGYDLLADVKQQIRFNLLVGGERRPEIADFRGRGDLRGWVRVMAIRLAMASLRRGSRSVPADWALLEAAGASPDRPELAYMKAHYRWEFARAVRGAIRELTPRERTLLRQHFLDELTIDEIGAIYCVHRATAARWLERARGALHAKTRSRLMERLGLEAAAFDSMLRLISSHLDVSVRALLQPRS